MEPLQSSLLVQHRPSPLSEAPQLSSPVYLTFPFNMCLVAHLMEGETVVIELPDVHNGPVLGVARPHVVRPPKQEVILRHWVPGKQLSLCSCITNTNTIT